jgi:hypothetical protein
MEKETAKSKAVTSDSNNTPIKEDIPVNSNFSLTKAVAMQSTGGKAPAKEYPSPITATALNSAMPAPKPTHFLTKQTATKSTGGKAPPKKYSPPNATAMNTAKPTTRKTNTNNHTGKKRSNHDDWQSNDDSADEMDGQKECFDLDDDEMPAQDRKIHEATSGGGHVRALEPGEPLLQDACGRSVMYHKLLLFYRCYEGILPEIVGRIGTSRWPCFLTLFANFLASFLYYHTDEYILYDTYGGTLAHWYDSVEFLRILDLFLGPVRQVYVIRPTF